LSVVFLLRLAERRFCGLLFQEPADDTATRDRPGFEGFLAGSNRLAPEDRVAQGPRVCVLSVSNPCLHNHINIVERDRASAPLVAQTAQPIAEAPNIALGDATAPSII
jgi:hypothetical protein